MEEQLFCDLHINNGSMIMLMAAALFFFAAIVRLSVIPAHSAPKESVMQKFFYSPFVARKSYVLILLSS